MTELLDSSPQSTLLPAAVAAELAAGARARDESHAPEFPAAAFALLDRAGLLAWGTAAGRSRPPAAQALALVRAVAAADGSVGRIFDGHLNAIERMAVQGDGPLRTRELAAIAAGELRAGVWGGDPAPDEGPPAALSRRSGRPVLRGVKTFCSGAGGLQRALVLARAEDGQGPPLSVWVDLTDVARVEIDTTWYRSHGLRASVSHRVVFHDAPVLANLGPPGAISAQPWFGRDALRTAASWAGMADAATEGALHELHARGEPGPLEGLAAGRILTAQRTISVWLGAAAPAMDTGVELGAVALHARDAIARSCRELLDEAARACGSRPFARGGQLDRSRRDLEVFLLQHRLDPMLARAGLAALATRDPT